MHYTEFSTPNFKVRTEQDLVIFILGRARVIYSPKDCWICSDLSHNPHPQQPQCYLVAHLQERWSDFLFWKGCVMREQRAADTAAPLIRMGSSRG